MQSAWSSPACVADSVTVIQDSTYQWTESVESSNFAHVPWAYDQKLYYSSYYYWKFGKSWTVCALLMSGVEPKVEYYHRSEDVVDVIAGRVCWETLQAMPWVTYREDSSSSSTTRTLSTQRNLWLVVQLITMSTCYALLFHVLDLMSSFTLTKLHGRCLLSLQKVRTFCIHYFAVSYRGCCCFVVTLQISETTCRGLRACCIFNVIFIL